jgi:hypothetical protein
LRGAVTRAGCYPVESQLPPALLATHDCTVRKTNSLGLGPAWVFGDAPALHFAACFKRPSRIFLRNATMLGGSLVVTMPSALVRGLWDEKWQLSRQGPLYFKMWLRNVILEQYKFGTCFCFNVKIDYGRTRSCPAARSLNRRRAASLPFLVITT